MQVAILGAGAVAYGNAALLCHNGHDVVLWSPSGRRTAALSAGAPLQATGAVEGLYEPRVAESCADALADAEAVVVAVPGYGYRQVIGAAAPHLRSEQVVVFSSHMSLGALYLEGLLRTRGVASTIAALGTTVTTGRQTSDVSVTVGTIRARVDVTVLPGSATTIAVDVCRALFGDRFSSRTGLLALALSNMNAQNHLAIALCNLTRMELGETWGQNRNLTPAVARLIEALDLERLSIAKAFGVEVRTVHEHFHASFGIPIAPLADMAEVLAQRPKGVNGPTTLDTRYVTEDVPFGLVPTIRLAALANVHVPLHASGLNLMSALYGRDFESENDILPLLGPLSLTMLNGAA
ncbi:NAD/NADP octopine/nopaline dehydrogenase family protein [Beijerinckia sp. L45]|uniref:NAD/NADP octopine/nopaline dehydrogenase family protein n=1 Tax=Beijerinckia sp. L45 TaxID=1641855 RepID=UPI00131C4AC5|nr:NAD/NADP octopine/nopaline dehydrogenase family protein [Beijerinckia sp. L45]